LAAFVMVAMSSRGCAMRASMMARSSGLVTAEIVEHWRVRAVEWGYDIIRVSAVRAALLDHDDQAPSFLLGGLVERHSFVAYRPKTYLAMEVIVLWTQPIATALRSLEATFRAGIETGDLTVACYSRNHTVIDLLLRGDPLEEVWRESEAGLDFVERRRDDLDVEKRHEHAEAHGEEGPEPSRR